MNLYLIDGSSYVYRAYHAIKGLTNSAGVPTNAVYGFTNMLLKILREKKPEGLCIVFDTAAPTERHRLYEDYKAQRPEAPGDLIAQIPVIKEVITAFRIPLYELPGYEADDIIGTLAKKSASQGVRVFIVTGDKDIMQVVDEDIVVYDPVKDAVADARTVEDRFGVPPSRIPEFMALAGDPVDNIPGVKGIGEKTARDLLAGFSSLDELIEKAGQIKNPRIRKMVLDNIDVIKLSRTLATIDTNVPVDIDIAEVTLKEPDWPSLLRLFTELDFKSFIRLIPAEAHKGRGDYRALTTRQDLIEFLQETA